MKPAVLVLTATLTLLIASEGADERKPAAERPIPQDAKPAAKETAAQALAASAAKWNKAKAECEGNYSYRVERGSFFGYRAETLIVVRGNKVVAREFRESPVGKPTPLELKWKESEKEVGTHSGAPIAEARTVDELYAIAEKIAATEPAPDHVRMQGFDERGLLHHCFTQDSRIRDDAPMTGVSGITIELPQK